MGREHCPCSHKSHQCHHEPFSIHPLSSAGRFRERWGAAHVPWGEQPRCSIKAWHKSTPEHLPRAGVQEEPPLPAPHMIRCSLSIIIKTRQMCVDLVRRPRRKAAPVALFSNLAVLMQTGLARTLPIKMIPSQYWGASCVSTEASVSNSLGFKTSEEIF